jgi:hypothetical protein
MAMKLFKDSKNTVYAYEEDGSQDHLIPEDYILIDEAEFKVIQDNLQKALQDSLTYVEKRKVSYPAIGDQLDLLWHAINEDKPLDKNSDFYQQLLQVKQQYPKSEG